MGKSVNIARQLGVDGVAAVQCRAAHTQTGVNIIRLAHHYGQVLKNKFHTFHRQPHVLVIHLCVAHRPFNAVAERVDTASGRDLCRRMNG